MISSPLGRNYRVVTKRKAFSFNGNVHLGLIGIEEESAGMNPVQVDQCMIEPEKHSAIYRCVQAYLNRRESKEAAEAVNYVIIKGNYSEFTVIFNLAAFDSNMRQFINRLSKHLTAEVKEVVGVFVIVDEKRSRYYMPQHQKNQRFPLQKIFGNVEVFQKISTKKFLFSPLSFSQTNLSIVETFVQTIKELLALHTQDRLLDLYCGYGLFSLSVSNSIKSATGIELSGDSVHDAKKECGAIKNFKLQVHRKRHRRRQPRTFFLVSKYNRQSHPRPSPQRDQTGRHRNHRGEESAARASHFLQHRPYAGRIGTMEDCRIHNQTCSSVRYVPRDE